MTISADLIKAQVATFWRYIELCPMVAMEASTRLSWTNAGGQSDVLVVNKAGTLIETEVKLNLSDMRKDREKEKHYYFYLDYFGSEDMLPEVKGWRYQRRLLKERPQDRENYPIGEFYFAVPADLEKEAKRLITELYPYAGLLVAEEIYNKNWNQFSDNVRRPKRAHHFDRAKLTERQVDRMLKEMSGTVCRISRMAAEPEDRSKIVHVQGLRM